MLQKNPVRLRIVRQTLNLLIFRLKIIQLALLQAMKIPKLQSA